MIFEKDKNLKELNTFGIDVRSRLFARAAGTEDVKEIIRSGEFGCNKVFIIGGGSNLLFTGDFDGLVISVDINGISVIDENDDYAVVEAGAGVLWHDLVKYCVDRNLGGLENLALIPGKAGSAPVQNIGAYGAEQKDVFHSLSGYRIPGGDYVQMHHEECRFAYRSSIFKGDLKDRFIITSVRYRLIKSPKPNLSYSELKAYMGNKRVSDPNIKDVFDAVCNIRRAKLPAPEELGNAGSFFRNPVVDSAKYEELIKDYPAIPRFDAGSDKVKIPAGWLIERAGLKGYRKGDAGVSAVHALILVNYGKAGGREIYNLSEFIIEEVNMKFGICLEREVQVI